MKDRTMELILIRILIITIITIRETVPAETEVEVQEEVHQRLKEDENIKQYVLCCCDIVSEAIISQLNCEFSTLNCKYSLTSCINNCNLLSLPYPGLNKLLLIVYQSLLISISIPGMKMKCFTNNDLCQTQPNILILADN